MVSSIVLVCPTVKPVIIVQNPFFYSCFCLGLCGTASEPQTVSIILLTTRYSAKISSFAIMVGKGLLGIEVIVSAVSQHVGS